MKKTKFTLLELLIVIAVIGILVTILLPSLRDARLASKTALSMNNLKQIYRGVISYQKSNNDYLFSASSNAHPCHHDPRIEWSRMVWEEMIGERLPLHGGQSQPLMMAGSAYWNLMYCPVLRETRNPTWGPQVGGGDYSMNRHFDRNRLFYQLEGKEEPFIAPGTTPRGNRRANARLFRGDFTSTRSGTLVYNYINSNTFALFIDGSVRFLSKSEGLAVDTDINNRHNFK